MKKDQLKALADDTLVVIENFGYQYGEGPKSTWVMVHSTEEDTFLYQEKDFPDFRTKFEVTDQTTLEAAQELTHPGDTGVGVLNFASAKNPGGGFLRGTQAQEESLARSSSLYASLSHQKCKPFYEHHKKSGDLLYSDKMIYTKNCVVFRDDAGNKLRKPYEVGVLTAAAPNLRAIKEKFTGEKQEQQTRLVPVVIMGRVRKILTVFSRHNCHTLVLGAWGCGVFGNDPHVVAEAFRTHLFGAFENRFRRVRFAIYGDAENLQAFKDWFQREINE